jgi:hypothetical protein
MSQLSGYLTTNRLSGAGSIAQFSHGVRTFVPPANTCGIMASTNDQFNRQAGYGSLNVLTNPGCTDPQEIMLNENSLRPVLASNPLYKNIQAGIGGNGASTLFGQKLPGLGWNNRQTYQLNVNNSAHCASNPNHAGFYNYPAGYVNDSKCSNLDMIPSFVGSRHTDMISNQLRSYP